MKPWQPVNMEKTKVRSPNKGSLLLLEAIHMNDRALRYLFAIMEQYDDVPYSYWPQYEAEETSFSKWAIAEITRLVWDHPWTMASDTIEEFAFKMEIFAATPIMDIQVRIFKIAAETARSILDSIQEIEQLG